jgi:hypothetical protein
MPQEQIEGNQKTQLVEVENHEFENIFSSPYHCFNKAEFNELNKHKSDKLFYWLFKADKVRLGLICGLMNGHLSSPFSSPFGGLLFLNKNTKIKYIEEAIDAILDKCNGEKLKFSITLPPIFYNETFVSKSINCLFRKGFKVEGVDLNYAYKLEDFTDNYLNTIERNAKKSLKKSFGFNLDFKECESDTDKRDAYEIIKQNRQSKGYPLHMTWEQIESTASIVPVDYFILRDSDKTAIASAIVFRVAKGIVQVIYWGNLAEFNQCRPMNYLSYKILEYYKKLNFKYVDIGPSSKDSIPNYGLCEFKESIGCHVVPKFSFHYDGTKV